MLYALSEAESKQHEIETWNAMTPGKILHWQNHDCERMPPAIVAEKGEETVTLIVLNSRNIESILKGTRCETLTLRRGEAYFCGVEEPKDFTSQSALTMPTVPKGD